MINNYNEKYFDTLKSFIVDYDIEFLKKPSIYSKNFVYILNDIPIGLISFSLIYDRIELDYLCVNPLYRRSGVASKLIDIMFEFNNILNITLEVDVKNLPAYNLYLKKGFKIVSVRKNYYRDSDAYLMMREMI